MQTLRKYRFGISLGFLIGIISACNTLWRAIESRSPHWDMARHLWTAEQYSSLIEQHRFHDLMTAYFYYPPLAYWIVQPFYAVFGDSMSVAVLSQVIFASILGVSTYLLGKRLWGAPTGLLAALIILTLPMVASQLKEYQVDAPLAAMVAATLYCLVASEEFRSRQYSILFGLVVGGGLLTKWTFGFVVGLPVGWAIGYALIRSYRERSWQRLIHMAAVGAIAGAIAGPWYWHNHYQLKVDILGNGSGAGIREGDPVVGSLASNVWYGWNLLDNQLYLIPLILVIVGVGICIWRRDDLAKNKYLILLLVGTLIFFTMLRNKDARYTMPIMVSCAILASYWILRLKWRGRILAGIIATYSVLSFYAMSFGLPGLPAQLSVSLGGHEAILFAQRGYIIGPPTHEVWRQAESVAYIARQSPGCSLIVDVPQSIWINGWGWAYYGERYHVPLTSESKTACYAVTTARDHFPAAKLIRRDRLPDGQELSLVRL